MDVTRQSIYATPLIVAALVVCLRGTYVEAATVCNSAPASAASRRTLEQLKANVDTIVVIYAENRSFDNLFGMFPGAEGIAGQSRRDCPINPQVDKDGKVLSVLPPTWRERTDPAKVDSAYPQNLKNEPFRIDLTSPTHDLDSLTRDLVHRFFQNQEQIDGGKNDRFASVSDAGGLTMGYYDGSSLQMWKLAEEYTLADHFFMGAFGGSFLNHFWLVCACTPTYKGAPPSIRLALEPGRRVLARTDDSPPTLQGPPRWINDESVIPGDEGYAVNTLQPPYQPSRVPPAVGGNYAYADPSDKSEVLPPQSEETIGDKLNDKPVRWAWYAGGWNEALDDGRQDPSRPRRVVMGSRAFQTHHMPFNYFKTFDPGTREGARQRAEHLKDYEDFVCDLKNGHLPPVAFYKPIGPLNEHPGYADVVQGDEHISYVVRKLKQSPQWPHMLIIITYDENGGFWDHVPPPATVDGWGPGTRVPAIIVSPFAKPHYVDHSTYDTTSILRLITERFDLHPLKGIQTRSGTGDLTGALDFAKSKHGN